MSNPNNDPDIPKFHKQQQHQHTHKKRNQYKRKENNRNINKTEHDVVRLLILFRSIFIVLHMSVVDGLRANNF